MNVLLVDDSIIRGTTMSQIVDMVRKAGAKRVYIASTSPLVQFPNLYGVTMSYHRCSFVGNGRTNDEVRVSCMPLPLTHLWKLGARGERGWL